MTGARRTLPRIFGLLVAIPLGLTPRAARPQAPTQSGSLGFKLGENNQRLHPFVDIDTHWVTNPGRLYVASASDVESTARLGYDLTLPSSIVELGSDAGIAYNRFWGVQDPATENLSNWSGFLNAKAIFNKEGVVELRLSENFVRSADAANQTVTERLLHFVEQAAIGLDWRPGGGALMLTVGGGFFYDRYDRSNTFIAPGSLDNLRAVPELRLSWKFLPKTALFVEAQAQLTYFTQTNLISSNVANIDSSMLTAQGGLVGNITRRLTLLAKAGYGNTFMAGGDDNLQTYVGHIELNFDLADTSRLRLGVLRTIQPASLFRYFALDRGYISYDQQIGAGTQLSLSPQYNLYDYGQEIVGGTSSRRDQDIVVDAMLSQRIVDWLTLSVVERLDYRISNFVTAVGNAGYFYNDVLLRVDIRY